MVCGRASRQGYATWVEADGTYGDTELVETLEDVVGDRAGLGGGGDGVGDAHGGELMLEAVDLGLEGGDDLGDLLCAGHFVLGDLGISGWWYRRKMNEKRSDDAAKGFYTDKCRNAPCRCDGWW